MRAFEVLVIASMLLALAAKLPHPTRGPACTALLAGTAVLAVSLHLWFEGDRWQMIPAYMLAALLFSAAAAGLGHPHLRPESTRQRRIVRRAGLVFGFVAAFAAAAASSVFPVFELPEPSGPHPIGITWDGFAARVRSNGSGVFGRVRSLQFWYPATAQSGRRSAPYMSTEAARAVTSAWRMPLYLLDHFALVRTHSCREAPPAPVRARLPVVLVAWSGLMTGGTALGEELASQGYAVVAIGNGDPGWSPFVFDSNGMVVPISWCDQRSEALRRELDSEAVPQIKHDILHAKNPRDRPNPMLELNRRQPLRVADVELCAAEVSAVIDRLQENNRLGFLAGRLDLDRVAIVGYSKGGAVAGQVCLKDPRVKAGVNLDGFMYGDIVHAPLARPFLSLHSENPDRPEACINDSFFEHANSAAYLLKVKGARHTSFGDMPLWGFFVRNAVGPSDGRRCVRVVNSYVRAFLDKHLRGMDAPLLAGPSSQYPEVEIRSRGVVTAGTSSGG